MPTGCGILIESRVGSLGKLDVSLVGWTFIGKGMG